MMTVYIQRKKCVKKWDENVPRMCLILFPFVVYELFKLHVLSSPLVILVSHSLTFLFLHSGFVSSFLQVFVSCSSLFLVFLLPGKQCISS